MSEQSIKKIFVVDDNEMLTFAMEDYLTSKTHHEVEVYSTGEECLEHLANNPDVIILDYNLNAENSEAANGAQILEIIKKANSNIRVIMLSGSKGDPEILETLSARGDNFVLKSEASFAEIAEIIANIH